MCIEHTRQNDDEKKRNEIKKTNRKNFPLDVLHMQNGVKEGNKTMKFCNRTHT